MRLIVRASAAIAALVTASSASAATAPFYDVTPNGALKQSDRARLAVKLAPGAGWRDASWKTLSARRGIFEYRGTVALPGQAANCGLRVEVRGAATSRKPVVRFGKRRPRTGSLRAPIPEAFDLAAFRFVTGTLRNEVGSFSGPTYGKLQYTQVRSFPVPRGLAARHTTALIRVDVTRRTFAPVTADTQNLCANADAGTGVTDITVVRR